MALPTHATRRMRIWHYTYLVICPLIFSILSLTTIEILRRGSEKWRGVSP